MSDRESMKDALEADFDIMAILGEDPHLQQMLSSIGTDNCPNEVSYATPSMIISPSRLQPTQEYPVKMHRASSARLSPMRALSTGSHGHNAAWASGMGQQNQARFPAYGGYIAGSPSSADFGSEHGSWWQASSDLELSPADITRGDVDGARNQSVSPGIREATGKDMVSDSLLAKAEHEFGGHDDQLIEAQSACDDFCKALKDSTLLAQVFAQIHPGLQVTSHEEHWEQDTLKAYADRVLRLWPSELEMIPGGLVRVTPGKSVFGEKLHGAIRNDSVEELIDLLASEVPHMSQLKNQALALEESIRWNMSTMYTAKAGARAQTQQAILRQIQEALNTTFTSCVGRNRLKSSSETFEKAIRRITAQRAQLKPQSRSTQVGDLRPDRSVTRREHRPSHGLKKSAGPTAKGIASGDVDLDSDATDVLEGKSPHGLSDLERRLLSEMSNSEKAEYGASLIEELCATMRANQRRKNACAAFDTVLKLDHTDRTEYALGLRRAASRSREANTRTGLTKILHAVMAGDAQKFDSLNKVCPSDQMSDQCKLADTLETLINGLRSGSPTSCLSARSKLFRKLWSVRHAVWHPVGAEKLHSLDSRVTLALKMIDKDRSWDESGHKDDRIENTSKYCHTQVGAEVMTSAELGGGANSVNEQGSGSQSPSDGFFTFEYVGRRTKRSFDGGETREM